LFSNLLHNARTLKESKRIKQVDESRKPYMKTGKKLAADDEVGEDFK
jgi:hypothetical protein